MLYVQPNQALSTNTMMCEKKNRFIEILNKRFQSYGYKEVETPMFEPYDLYSRVEGLIHQEDMIKVIDTRGKVLVLRPDVTIPLARMMAQHTERLKTSRYFYTMDVFRQMDSQTMPNHHKQAGVECFGNASPAVDAEVLALAKHIFRDIDFPKFTLEIGHAGFVEEVRRELALPEAEWEQLKLYLQAKNKNDLDAFLQNKKISNDMKEIVQNIPDLYGRPEAIITKVRELALTPAMNQAIDNLEAIYQQLEFYQMEEQVVINMGLVNHMSYYSDIIFQGFIQEIGKPILMGGRYDKLTDQFGKEMPAIGFACDIDLVLKRWEDFQPENTERELILYYDATEEVMQDAYTLASFFREAGWNVLCTAEEKEVSETMKKTPSIFCKKHQYIYRYLNKTETFSTQKDLVKRVQEKG